jgi:hypothetical protein
LDGFHLIQSGQDSVDVLEFELDYIIKHPHRWVVVLNLMGCVFKSWFVSLGVVERIGKFNIFIGVFFDNDWSLLFSFRLGFLTLSIHFF